MTVPGFANEIPLFLCAIVIRLAEGATAVRHQRSLLKVSLRKRVVMPAERRLQIVFSEHIQHGFGVQGAFLHLFAQRKMRKRNRRYGFADFFQRARQEFNRRFMNSRLICVQPFGAVKTNELPAVVDKIIVESPGKNRFVSPAVCLRHIIMIARQCKYGDRQGAEDLFYRPKFRLGPMMRKIPRQQAEFRLRSRFYFLKDAIKESSAFLVDIVDVVYNREIEISRLPFPLRPQSPRPKPQRQQGAGTKLKHATSRKITNSWKVSVHKHLFTMEWPGNG